jgi:hypothetical protein
MAIRAPDGWENPNVLASGFVGIVAVVAGLTPLPPLHQRWRGGSAGAWLLGLLAARYGADVVHLHHIFGFFPVLFDTTIRLAYNRSRKLHRAYNKGEGP